MYLSETQTEGLLRACSVLALDPRNPNIGFGCGRCTNTRAVSRFPSYPCSRVVRDCYVATMAHYDIFREQLAIRFPGYGHALWEPSSGDLYRVAGIGDVGYITEGRFHRLFNILLPADDPSHENFGVPDNHTPFKPEVPKHVTSGILRPDNFCSVAVTLDFDEYDGPSATRLSRYFVIRVSCH